MARTADRSSDDFRAAVRELNAFLSPVGDEDAPRVLGDLDEGCDALLFYGLTVNERIEVEDGMEILPFEELRRFVELEFVKELAPRGAGFHGWRGVGALISPFRWRPVFRRRGSVNEPPRCPPERFLPDAGTFLDLLAVSHAAPVLPLASISGCIDRAAARLFGVGSQGPGFYQKWAADGLDGFDECPVLRPSAFQDAREAFRDRASARFQRLAPIVGRLAVALARDGRLAINDKVVDVAIALEGMYELPRWKKLIRLEHRVSGFLGTAAEEVPRIKENLRMLYETRSDIVHGGSARGVLRSGKARRSSRVSNLLGGRSSSFYATVFPTTGTRWRLQASELRESQSSAGAQERPATSAGFSSRLVRPLRAPPCTGARPGAARRGILELVSTTSPRLPLPRHSKKRLRRW